MCVTACAISDSTISDSIISDLNTVRNSTQLYTYTHVQLRRVDKPECSLAQSINSFTLLRKSKISLNSVAII